MYAAMLEESTRTQKALKAETAELNIKLEDQNRLFEETKKVTTNMAESSLHTLPPIAQCSVLL